MTFTVKNLRCEYLENPLGIDTSFPRFSWILKSDERGKFQIAYRILVASTHKNIEEDNGDVFTSFTNGFALWWDTGKVESDNSVNIEYEGDALKSGEKYYWKVRAWDENDQPGHWSDVSTFQMGLLKENEWEGKWIGAEDKHISSPLLRKEFKLNKEIEEAYIYISGLGYYELYINGNKVGDHVLDPGTTDYNKRVLYETYNVTDYLKTGANAVGVMLGNGWFSPGENIVKQSPAPLKQYGDRPKLILQLNVKFSDGTKGQPPTPFSKGDSIVTDDSWKVSNGPITENSVWNGETYDARLEKTDWKSPGYDDSGWNNAVVVEAPGGVLDSQLTPPIKVTKTLDPVKMTEPKDGVYVYDFGQNFTGWPELYVKGPKGAEVTLKTAEITKPDMARMKDESFEGLEGTIDQSPNRSARATDVYILKGNGEEVYEPTFTYHGFRYVQVEGFPGKPTLDNLKARVVHSAVKPVGNFCCSNSLLNQIHHNIIWGQLSNLHSIPTDCPQRDERQGWMGDGHLTAEEAMYNFDMAPFYTKWLNDIKDAQKEDGSLTDVVPPHWDWKGTPAWQVAYPLVTWYMYQYYGDLRVLEEHYPTLKKWVDYFGSTANNYIVEWGRGDWCPPKRTEPADGSVPITSTGYYYLGAQIVSQIAEILGKSDDAEYYSSLADKIKNAFNEKYLNKETNQYGTGSQTSNAFPLYLGIVPEDNIPEVVNNLVRNIMVDHDGHLWTGILGTKALVETLTEYGQGEVMYKISTQTTFPSWGYMVEKGATTLWERWGGYKYFGPDMNSLNHIMFGSVDEFFYKHLAGIKPASPGYERITIKPHILGDLESATASVETVRGLVSSKWLKDGNSLTLEVTIPVNTQGEVSIPKMGLENVTVKEGDKTIWKDGLFRRGVDGIIGAIESEGYVTFEVGSGSYCFELIGRSSLK
jgi:alpha-L-rhamnosidase